MRCRAPSSKSLARIDKSRTWAEATKKRRRRRGHHLVRWASYKPPQVGESNAWSAAGIVPASQSQDIAGAIN
jgi:hypothetical protein